MAIRIEQIMTSAPLCLSEKDTLKDVKRLFEKHSFHHILVTDSTGVVAGIISDRDLLKQLSPFLGTYAESKLDRGTLDKTAWQLMTPNPVVAMREQTVPEAARMLVEYGISCLPVVDKFREPVGILSWKDIMKVVARANG